MVVWDKTTTSSALYAAEKLFFLLLCFLEFFYKLGFWSAQKVKLILFPRFKSSIKVIAVGNLSVGGTGKSVVIQFLAKNLNRFNCAIVSRGYKRSKKQEAGSLLVSDGKHVFYKPDDCGDEPFMLAQALNIPLAVGSNRINSVQLLMNNAHHNEQNLDVILLDDGYQNEQLVKDLQILLLDARKPFENGHCLPAGRLREKDYTRANIIILTHADCVNSMQLQHIKNQLSCTKKQIPVFSGMHKPIGLFRDNQPVFIPSMVNRPLLACAGIGSFSSFTQSLELLGLCVIQKKEFPDHHQYAAQDLKEIIKQASLNNCVGIVTTEKDWCKLELLCRNNKQARLFTWYVMRIEFEFLTADEYHTFMKVVTEKLS